MFLQHYGSQKTSVQKNWYDKVFMKDRRKIVNIFFSIVNYNIDISLVVITDIKLVNKLCTSWPVYSPTALRASIVESWRIYVWLVASNIWNFRMVYWCGIRWKANLPSLGGIADGQLEICGAEINYLTRHARRWSELHANNLLSPLSG